MTGLAATIGLTPIAKGQYEAKTLRLSSWDSLDKEDVLGKDQLDRLKPYILHVIDQYGDREIKSLKDRVQVITVDNQAAFVIAADATEKNTEEKESSDLSQFLVQDYVLSLEKLPANERRITKIQFLCELHLTENFFVSQPQVDGTTDTYRVMRFENPKDQDKMVVYYTTLGDNNNFDAAMAILAKMYPSVHAKR